MRNDSKARIRRAFLSVTVLIIGVAILSTLQGTLLFNCTNAATTPVLAIRVSPNPSDEGQNVNISGRLTDTSGNRLPGYYVPVEWSPYNLGWTTLEGPFLAQPESGRELVGTWCVARGWNFSSSDFSSCLPG